MTTHQHTPTTTPADDAEVDAALEDSFPASDPPSFTRGGNDDIDGRLDDVDLDERPGWKRWLAIAIPAGVAATAVAGIVVRRKRRRKLRDRVPV